MPLLPKPPSLAITVFGISGFMAAVLGAVIAVLALVVIIAAGAPGIDSTTAGAFGMRGSNLLVGGFLTALLGLGGFRLARAMEEGRGFYVASAAIFVFGLLGIVAVMPLNGEAASSLQMGLGLTTLVFAAMAGGSLHEGRGWFTIEHAPKQRRAQGPRRLTITFGAPAETPRTAQAKGSRRRAAKPTPRTTRSRKPRPARPE